MPRMDWYLGSETHEAFRHLRHDFRSYLERHGREGGDVDEAELVFAEVVGNAVRHAGGPVWISLSWRGPNPDLTVRDLGPGFDTGQLDPPPPTAESGRGLLIVSHLATRLEAHARAQAGTSVTVTLPVTRPPVGDQDPPRQTVGALPGLDEARPEGAFGRETFLRALVVQLAQVLELQHGPDAADAAVAQVGTDVGGQMEQEYRDAVDVVGRMTPEQMADCYVRLKHAIDGGFYVIEANERQIVLGNTRCPFGDLVRRAPSLCQMTSSVFGGIAARNSANGASVMLEERIAVGDPGCRVVVYLGDPPADERANAQRYVAPSARAAG